jgi:hypothetical protein
MNDTPQDPLRARMADIIAEARQMLYPAAVRIARPAFPRDVGSSEEATQPDPSSRTPPLDQQALLGTLAAVATAVWRVRSRLEAVAPSTLPSELRHLPRHVDAAWDALLSAGFIVKDPKGQRYVPGLAVNPVAFQPVDGVDIDIIAETLKPSIQYQSLLIQRADVIVARPPEESSAPTKEESGIAGGGVSASDADTSPPQTPPADGRTEATDVR